MNTFVLSRVHFWMWMILLAIVCRSTHAQPFYQVLSTTNCVVTGLSTNGTLTFSNSAATGGYLIQKATNFDSGAWTPVTHAKFTNANVSIKVTEPNPPTNMVFIPGGTFQMGDVLNDFNNATPVHSATVSPFYFGKYEVTSQQAIQVWQWAYDNGLISTSSEGVLSPDGTTNVIFSVYHGNSPNKGHDSDVVFTNRIFGIKASRTNYPCIWISWYGAVTYCNLLSIKEGREQCYNLTNWTCDFTKNGYRLPTETEWEWAARGGYEGLRFPWADTNVITHARANYRSTNAFSWDVSPTRGFNPLFTNYPPCYSAPVGYFAPNNFGLYDMTGNVWEWCWDWAGRYPSAAQVDPTGPTTGTSKTFRGGSWLTIAQSVTCASRYTSESPLTVFDDIGLRLALPYRSQ